MKTNRIRILHTALRSGLCLVFVIILSMCNSRSTDQSNIQQDTTENDINYSDTTGTGARADSTGMQRDSLVNDTVRSDETRRP